MGNGNKTPGEEPGAAIPRLRRPPSPPPVSELIDEVLKPQFLPVIRPTEFNYPVDICGKWHGTRYRFIQRYRSGLSREPGQGV